MRKSLFRPACQYQGHKLSTDSEAQNVKHACTVRTLPNATTDKYVAQLQKSQGIQTDAMIHMLYQDDRSRGIWR